MHDIQAHTVVPVLCANSVTLLCRSTGADRAEQRTRALLCNDVPWMRSSESVDTLRERLVSYLRWTRTNYDPAVAGIPFPGKSVIKLSVTGQ